MGGSGSRFFSGGTFSHQGGEMLELGRWNISAQKKENEGNFCKNENNILSYHLNLFGYFLFTLYMTDSFKIEITLKNIKFRHSHLVVLVVPKLQTFASKNNYFENKYALLTP